MSAVDMVTKAKANLLSIKPFYAAIALRLEYVEVTEEMAKDNPLFQTMATDGQRIYYNTKFTESLTRDECMGVIAHEILHVALLHSLRLRGRDSFIWNIACDFAINSTLLEDNFKLPQGGMINPKYTNWNAEAVYDDLMKNHSVSGKTKSGAEWGAVIPPVNGNGEPLSEAERSMMEAEVKVMVTQAAESAKNIGNLPGCIQEVIDKYSKPKVQWRDYLPHWLTGSQPDNYTWRRPSRKWLHRDLYLPSVEKIGCGRGILGVDSSGSVSTKELQAYLGEMVGMIEDCRPDALTIVVCDTKIQNIITWEPGTDLTSIECSGRGGTLCGPIFNFIEENINDLDWCVYFTDLEIGDFPKHHPEIPVLWLSTGKTQAPFGKVVKINAD